MANRKAWRGKLILVLVAVLGLLGSLGGVIGPR